jgi:hypothetical protein
MTHDPYRNRPVTDDPSDPYRDRPMATDPYRARASRGNSPWVWLAGIAAVVIIAFIVWASVDRNTDTASTPTTTQSSPSTTGSAPSPAPATPPRETKGSAK